MRGVDNYTHQAAGDNTGDGKSQDPASVTPDDHAPVEGLEVTVAESDTHGSTDDTLGCGDGNSETGGHDDSNSGAKLHGETTGRRMEGQAVTQVAHDVVTISPETNDNTGSTVGKDPDRNRRLLCDGTRIPDQKDGGKRTDGVRYVIGTVSEGRGGSGENLKEGVQMLSLVIKVSSAGVHVDDVANKIGTLFLFLDNVPVNTVHETSPESLGKVLRKVPWASVLLLNFVESLSGLLSLSLDGLNIVGALTRKLGLLGSLEMLHVGYGTLVKVSGLEILAGSMATVVVLDDLDVETLWGVGDGATLEEERTLEEVVPFEGPVVVVQLAVQPREEEGDNNEHNSASDSEDSTANLSRVPVIKIQRSSTLPDDQHGQDTGGNTEVDGDHDKTPLERVAALEHTILGDQEDDGGKASSNTRGNDPGSDNLGNTFLFPAPRHTLGSSGCNSKTNDTTSDTVGR